METQPTRQETLQGAAFFFLWLFLAMGLLVASRAYAEFRPTLTSPKELPASLHWQVMPEVAVNFKPMYPRATPKPEQVQLARSMWADEIGKQQSTNPNAAQFILLDSQPMGTATLTMAIISLPLDFERCEPAANGKDVVDMYSKCLARVALTQGGKTQTAQFPGVCYLNIDSDPRNAPLSQNHTEMAVDAKSATVYLRVIQHGKPVQACNRAVRLG